MALAFVRVTETNDSLRKISIKYFFKANTKRKFQYCRRWAVLALILKYNSQEFYAVMSADPPVHIASHSSDFKKSPLALVAFRPNARS